MKKFEEYDRLPLSALKQFIYCKKRFALMYLECEWGENYKIVEGDLLHKSVNDPTFNEKRRDVYVSRSVPVFSSQLNLYGVADIVEFINNDEGIKLPGKKGLWKINPVEYKNGKPEKSNADNYQLCAQAMCLEEMFQTEIKSGDIFYGKIKRRVTVDLTNELKESVKGHISNMSEILMTQVIPIKSEDQNCHLCSLIDVCIPTVFGKQKKFKDQISTQMRGN
ncbi:MAG: CRISPR-associated protein Cas4 [Eubacteriaceae bacterium]|nr:CRISPR-associated protein Cas4 [Eubacteriaceae bacterium]